ncbi:MAG TPA: HNH endonuclease signature motif containing protein, partial [Jatrophihabitantaceae bacterium]|nr:HNH endonuclease signature motif containing protein [Jatrophihabitantaceae bacterium]
WCEVNHVDRWEHGGTTDIDSLALVCTHNHDDLERGASIVMINGRAHWIEPAWIDPSQTPRLNTAHHLPRIFTADLGAAREGKQDSEQYRAETEGDHTSRTELEAAEANGTAGG